MNQTSEGAMHYPLAGVDYIAWGPFDMNDDNNRHLMAKLFEAFGAEERGLTAKNVELIYFSVDLPASETPADKLEKMRAELHGLDLNFERDQIGHVDFVTLKSTETGLTLGFVKMLKDSEVPEELENEVMVFLEWEQATGLEGQDENQRRHELNQLLIGDWTDGRFSAKATEIYGRQAPDLRVTEDWALGITNDERGVVITHAVGHCVVLPEEQALAG